MQRRIAALTVAALLTGAAGVSAQDYASQSLERYFRLEWEVTRGRKGPAIERLDASGKIVGSTTIWVFGGVPVNSRAYFSASVPDATSYRVQVLSFDWTGLGT